MNVTDVLTLTKTGGPKVKEGQGIDSDHIQGDSFSRLLNSLTTTGQITEEHLDDNLKAAIEGLEALQQQLNNGDIFGLNAYLQILQNAFPAGKEANSGLMGEISLDDLQTEVAAATEILGHIPIGEIKQSIESSHLQFSLAEMVEQTPFNMKNVQLMNQVSQNVQSNTGERSQALSQIDFGLEGIISPNSREIKSLNSKELDQYIETLEQLQELSGQIEVKKDQRTRSGEISGNINGMTLMANQNLKHDTMANVNADANSSSCLELTGQDKLNSEIQPIQIMTGRTETTSHFENVMNSNIKIPQSGRAWEQVLDVLKRQDLNAKEVKELSIRLQPADLGQVNVSLRMENGQLHVMMNASEQATSVILQSHLQDLKNGLTQMGLACGQFQLNSGQNGDGQSAKDFNRDSKAYRSKQQDEEVPSLTAAINPYYSAHGSGGRINVSA